MNQKVEEIDISDCNLDVEDLEKISYRLSDEIGISSLKLGQNQFDSIVPLIQLLKLKGKNFKILDVSGSPVN
jgi:hypothetical protein